MKKLIIAMTIGLVSASVYAADAENTESVKKSGYTNPITKTKHEKTVAKKKVKGANGDATATVTEKKSTTSDGKVEKSTDVKADSNEK